MKVAIQPGLEKIAPYLTDAGHQVVPMGAPCDAAVYRQGGFSALSCRAEVHADGVLLIQAQDKSPAQILAMLKTRVYSPLL